MTTEDLMRFAADLQEHIPTPVELRLADDSDGLHVLTISGVDFFFCADNSGYDGWGKALDPPPS